MSPRWVVYLQVWWEQASLRLALLQPGINSVAFSYICALLFIQARALHAHAVQFRTLAFGLYGSQEHHGAVRDHVVTYIKCVTMMLRAAACVASEEHARNDV